MRSVHFQNAPQHRSRGRISLRLERQSEAIKPLRRTLDKNNFKTSSQAEVVRQFTRMTKAHDRIRREILGVSHSDKKVFSADPNAAQATRVIKKRSKK